jgi:hypothetical protein
MVILCVYICFFSYFSINDTGLYSPLVMKVRSRAGSSVMSGASTPGGGAFKSLSERDLQKADAALSQVNGVNSDDVNGNLSS